MQNDFFNRIILKTLFCCMASDGKIDEREIILIKKFISEDSGFGDIDSDYEINQLIQEINNNSKMFFNNYYKILDEANFDASQELKIIDYAIRMIKSDELIEYSEIKFFKTIRHRLKVSNEIILKEFPGVEIFLEEDIKNISTIDKITKQYFDDYSIPKFDLRQIT